MVLGALVGGGVFGLSQFALGILPAPVRDMLGIVYVEPVVAYKKRPPNETVLINLEPMSLPMIRDNDIDRFLVLHILIETLPGQNAEKINQNLLRIVDGIITYVHALSALDIKPGLEDKTFLKQRLMAMLEGIVGEDVILDLLFQNVFERPIK